MPTPDKIFYHNIDLASNELKNGRIYNLTTTQRVTLGTQLTSNSKGYIVYDITLLALYLWNGSAWVSSSGGGGGTVTSVSAGTGMNFTTITTTGSIDIDITKVPYIPAGFTGGFLKWSTTSSIWTFDNSTYVPTSRTLTINGVTYDLSANRSWTISSSGGILHATASGTDTYTVSLPAVTSYADGDAYLIRFPNGNTTAATIAFNTLATVPLYRNNDGPLIGGDILAGAEMLLVYNSTLVAFQCIGTSPNTMLAYVTNADSVTITKGQAVYAFGGTGDRMTVKRANNTSDATSAQTIGIVMSTSIAANQKGIIMVQGLLDGLSVLPSSVWNDGDPVYLGATAGSLTKIKPYAPNHLVYLGVVTTASPGSAGRMYVRVQNGYELDELHNVQAQSPVDKATLYYDLPNTQWKTDTLSTILGFTPENVANKATNLTSPDNTKYPTTQAVATGLAGKVDANTVITGATKTKVTYDSKGLVTAGADATTADIADSTNKRYVSDSQLTDIGTINSRALATLVGTPAELQLAASDEITALTTTGTKITFRMPHAMSLTSVRGSLTTAQASGSLLTVDVRVNGTSVFSTLLTFDNNEKTTITATTPAVLTANPLAISDDAEVTIHITQVGTSGATGLKVTLKGNRA
jgi:hypothetical protein